MKHWPTILLVEDEASDAFVFQEALRDHSIPAHLQQVPDGLKAIEYLKGEGQFSNRQTHPLPGLVVLDLSMPGLDGMSLLRWIRKQPWLLGLPVVVFTGSEGGKFVAEAMESGADTYVIKGRETRGLVHLLGNVDLTWAARYRAPRRASSEAGTMQSEKQDVARRARGRRSRKRFPTPPLDHGLV